MSVFQLPTTTTIIKEQKETLQDDVDWEELAWEQEQLHAHTRCSIK